MNWKLHIFWVWFLEFVVVSSMYILEPLSSLVALFLMTPSSIIVTYIICTEFREKEEKEEEK